MRWNSIKTAAIALVVFSFPMLLAVWQLRDSESRQVYYMRAPSQPGNPWDDEYDPVPRRLAERSQLQKPPSRRAAQSRAA